MMRKFFVIFTPIALIAVSMIIMLSGTLLKQPTGDWDNVLKHMDATTKAIMSDDWTLAEKMRASWRQHGKLLLNGSNIAVKGMRYITLL
jgi:hypothetical protein